MRRRIWAIVAVAAVAAAIGVTYAVADGGGPPAPSVNWAPPAASIASFTKYSGPRSSCKGQWIVMNQNGTAARACGVTAYINTSPGIYEIQFKKPVVNCAPQVTVGNNTDAQPFDGVPGYFGPVSGDPRVEGVTVYWQPTTTYYNGDFTLVETC